MKGLISAILVSLMSLLPVVAGAQEVSAPELFIELEVAKPNVYEREAVEMSVILYSSTPDIAGINEVSAPALAKGSFSTLRPVDNPGQAVVVDRGGRKYWSIPLKRYIVSFADKGKYEVKGGVYDVDVAYPVLVRDPFWGTRRSNEIKKFSVKSNGAAVKVRNLPATDDGTIFSGSVGTFTVETIIPRGDIVVNEEATAYILLRGTGIIAENTLPEYRPAFGDGTKLRSIQETSSASYLDGKMVSELQLECTFIPTRKDNVSIGKVIFEFFNPETGKYEVVESAPVEVKVKSSVSKMEIMDI